MKQETSSPTISIEPLFLTCVINAMGKWHIIMCNIPGASMQADMDEQVLTNRKEGERIVS